MDPTQPPANSQPPLPPPDGAPQQMYYTRPLEPQKPEISQAMREKHEESKRRYPHLNLSDGEYVISDVRRHPIGLVNIWTVAGLVIGAVLAGMWLLLDSGTHKTMAIPVLVIAVAAMLLCGLTLLAGYIGTFVYTSNRFYLTNESVIQNIQMSLFSNREQTVSLANIEDASYLRHGFIQHFFDYGTLRLSTEGDETTYRFPFASSPAKQIAVLNNAVEAFKNGRPIEPAN